MPNPYARRTQELRKLRRKESADALLITSPADCYYLSGVTGEAGALIVSQRHLTLVTDGRFTVQAAEELRGVTVVEQKEGLYRSCGELLKNLRARKVGFDPNQVTVAHCRLLKTAAGRATQFKQIAGLVARLRARKDPAELAQMRKAALLASEVVESAIGMLKPGVREFEIAAEIEYQMRRRGASGPAFETIVAFGARSAHPHARPTEKRLRKNELVVLDLGVILGHYCSDITRTVFVGRAPARIRRWYGAVQEAQAAAVAAAQAGISCGDVDAAARGVLARYQLDRYFVHSSGHGLGLEVHEDPRVARGQKHVLVPGNVITIEPGVYVPGVGGIRIEDDVAVHADRTEVLTRVPRDLIEI